MSANFADVLETLFWLVIIIIWIVSQFRKKGKDISGPALSKSSKPDDNQKDKRVGIRNFFEEITRMQDGGQKKFHSQREEPAEELEIIHPEPVIKESRHAKAEVTRPTPKHSSGEEIRTPRSPVPLSLSRKNLRQAVIFSEILALPIALRDDGRGGSPNLNFGSRSLKNDESGASTPHFGNISLRDDETRESAGNTLWQQLIEE
ncbi:hypothetical protein QUF72_19565 [Desulfobacterales bacterium HSG2]|nr:hypothetical protein [Desulfobacterales bacterium HSG2]